MRFALTPLLLGFTLLALGCPSNPKAEEAQSAPAADLDQPIPVGSAAGQETGGAAAVESDEWVDRSADANPADLTVPEGHPEVPSEDPELQAPADTAPPPFTVTTLDGKRLSSTDLYGTKPVLITIWATWCGPCVAEAPILDELYGEYGDQVQFIAISIDAPSKAAAVKAFPAKHGVDYPIAHDTSGQIGRDFEANAIPLNVLVGADGKVVQRVTGFEGPRFKDTFRKAFKLAPGAAANDSTGV
ncbi:MAG TPA: TlpA disulfide reductase family protein [bacterium]|nr:TlpA disulfide reductase family protein [bacterium]